MESIQMKTAKIAADNWGQQDPKTLEESLAITGDSEVAAVQGIVKSLGLDESVVDKLVGTKSEDGTLKRDGEIYTSDTLSPEMASLIREAIKGDNKAILSILSTIHDAWIKNHANNFLKPGRNKERQFVPLQLLNWGEVESDLLFLKPILEAAGIQINEEQLKKSFELQQQEYMIDNKIFSREDLIAHLSRGAKSYEALEGLETINGGNIEALLQNPEVVGQMATQIESKVSIKTREELAMDIIKSDTVELDEVAWVKTVVKDNPTWHQEKFPSLNSPISKREILLSKLIGKPYPTYFLETMTDYRQDSYRNEIVEPRDAQWDYADSYERRIVERKDSAAKAEAEHLDKKGIVEFGYDRSLAKMQGKLEVSERDLLAAGLDVEKMGMSLDLAKKVTHKDIAQTDQERGLTTTEVGGVRGIIQKIMDKIKDEGEKQ